VRRHPAMTNLETPIRAGVFDLRDMADKAVQRLVDAGFDPEKITVVCSERSVREFFPDLETLRPAGKKAPARATVGGAIGGLLGGVTAAALATSTGLGVFVAGAVLVLGGAGAGSFIGAMTARGVGKELADYYDQALEQGKILVAVETADETRAADADRVFEALGIRHVELPRG
jgi:outer membrane lipoprotein SlyB